MRAWRTLKRDSPQCGVRFAPVDLHLVAVRRSVRRSAARCRRDATWCSSHRDAVFVAVRRGGRRTATRRTSRCDKPDISLRENDAALRRGEHQSAREQRRSATKRTSARASTTPRCDEPDIGAREKNVRLREVSVALREVGFALRRGRVALRRGGVALRRGGVAP